MSQDSNSSDPVEPSGADEPHPTELNKRGGVLRTLRDLAIGLVLACVVAELAVLAIWGEQPKFPRRVVEAPWGLRYNDPGAHYRHKSADVNVHFQINHQGMRADHDYAYAKPANVFRVVSLGDSFAMGYEVEPEQIYSSLLEQQLTAAGHPTEVLNAGVSGFSTAEELLYLERELIKYHPDLVLLGFYYNDFEDNVRTDLFSVDDRGQLHEKNPTYVPLGRVGNLLNSNPIFNFLSEYSNAFVLAKERATFSVKRMMVEHAEGEAKKAAAQELEVPDPTSGDLYPVSDYERALTVGLLERLYRFCHEHDVGLIVMSIPTGGIPDPDPTLDRPMVDLFPYDQFDADRPGLAVLPVIDLLEPYYGKQELVHRHSHRHWTPFAHRIAGDALTKLALERGLVPGPSKRPAAAEHHD